MLPADLLAGIDALLAPDDAELAGRAARPRRHRQPVHTVYVPADQFRPSTVAEWRGAALDSLDRHGPLPGDLAALDGAVRDKLHREPIEDLRIDFEDGYGQRPDEEDDDVRAAGAALARILVEAGAPAFCGIRIKSLEAPTRRRAIRSLDLFLDTVLATTPLPPGFRVTLPKVTSVRQVDAFSLVADALESAYGLASLAVELQIEMPQAVLGADGRALLAPMLAAAGSRCAGLHYGTYDYSAALGIAAAEQSLDHPSADHAKAVMQVAAAVAGVSLSDGSTNVLPVGATTDVRAAWVLHAGLVRRSLVRGFYQGWDLHPAQLPTRYAANFAFYRSGLPAAGARLRAYLDRASTGLLDEPATARALADYLLRGLEVGAVSAAEVRSAAGTDRAHLDRLSRS